MIRRSLLVLVVVGIGSIPGCGMAMRKMGGEPLLGAWTESRTHQESPHRVALAVLEAMRIELASADFAPGQESQFSRAVELMAPGMAFPKPGEATPPNYPAFWVEWNARDDGHKQRSLVRLVQAHFEGKARDGRPVQVDILKDVETVVTVRAGRHGDARVGKALLARIDDRLAHPLHPPGSAEEAETFRAFFGGVESREAIPSLRKPAEGSAR